MLTIWGRRNSLNVQKVMWTVGELGLDHVRHDVGGSFGGLDTEEFARLNPNRRIPVIKDDDFVLWESHAVVRYLAARYDAGGLWPQDPPTRAIADQWMDWMQTTLLPDLGTLFYGLVHTPVDQRDAATLAAATERIAGLYMRLNRWLADRPYVAGGSLTMGDIPLGTATFRYYSLDIAHATLPHVEAWYQRLQERPAYQSHVMIPFGSSPDEWRALEQAGTWDATGVA